MRVIIIGGGVIGLTSAYFLRCGGYEVTLLDRQPGPGRETSFANGALLTPSMSEPWNAPGCWRVLLGSLGRSDAPLQLRLSEVSSLAGWGYRFLKNSKLSLFERNTLSNLRLGLYSLRVLRAMREQTRIDYGGGAAGIIKIFRDPASLDRAVERANRFAAEGLTYRRLSPTEAAALEPALSPITPELAGALHFTLDETGDAYRFCVALTAHLEQAGVECRFGTDVSSLEVRAGRVVAAVSEGGRFVADRYVVAAGSYSTPILRQIGIHLPVVPAKGYSVTFDADGGRALGIPLVDDDWHAVVVPMGGAVRVAGTAEFAGFDRTVHRERVRTLERFVKQVLPEARLDLAAGTPWCGLRAMAADGVPIIGQLPVSNLFVNTGHGHLGWTLAAGSGQVLADLMSGKAVGIDAAPYSPGRL